MSTETPTAMRTACPSCQTKGKRVGLVTLRLLLKSELAASLETLEPCDCPSAGECRTPTENTGWRFCDSTGCDMVYFSETAVEQFTLPDLKVDVGVKQTSGERPLCYCFGHSVASIKAELQEKGRSDALDDIREKMKSPGCHCSTANPSGACCLGSVSRGIETARAELDSDERGSHVPIGRANRRERIAKAGTLVSAIIASSCCWLPLVLLAVGVSGAGIAATMEAFRPIFIVVTFGFLAAAFYFTYRPRKAAAGTDCCSTEGTDQTCCETAGNSRFSLLAANKVMLWLVTAAAVAFLLFPNYVGALIGQGSDEALTADMRQTTFAIKGMTCEGCAATVAQTIRKVPGVLAVEVDYAKAEAVVGTEPGVVAPVRPILAALADAGYQGTAPDGVSPEPDRADEVTTHARTNDELAETVFRVDGMSCEGCATALVESLRKVPGVTGARVDFESGRAIVQHPACCALPKDVVLSTIEKAGFRGHVENSNNTQIPKGAQQ